MRYMIKYISATVLAAFFTACSTNLRDGGGDVLVRVGNDVFTRDDLRGLIPPGSDELDSLRISRACIRSWIDSRLISEIAARNIGDLSEIDRQVEDYRNELIAYEYRRRMGDQRAEKSVSDDSLKVFYEANKQRYKLQSPVVRGLFIKVPEDAPELKTIRRLYRSKTVNDIDRIEKECLDHAVAYDYFRDR
ncbi:MAG: peptidylprolyl isomerase [Muribaculaceae bacterium]|nr:peptidylprolyl isomerase [Muribaculaceae bacterium]